MNIFKEYKRLMKIIKDLRDIKFIHRHKGEKLIPMREVHNHLEHYRGFLKGMNTQDIREKKDRLF